MRRARATVLAIASVLALETASATPAEAHEEIIGRVVVATDREPHGVARPDPQQARMQRVAVARIQSARGVEILG